MCTLAIPYYENKANSRFIGDFLFINLMQCNWTLSQKCYFLHFWLKTDSLFCFLCWWVPIKHVQMCMCSKKISQFSLGILTLPLNDWQELLLHPPVIVIYKTQLYKCIMAHMCSVTQLRSSSSEPLLDGWTPHPTFKVEVSHPW